MSENLVNPLDASDKELIKNWINKKRETLEYTNSGFNQEDFDPENGDREDRNNLWGDNEFQRFGEDEYIMEFEETSSEIHRILDKSLINMEDLNFILQWVDYLCPNDEEDNRHLDDIVERIETKIHKVELREN